MGSVPSRETHRRGIFSVQQQFAPSNDKSTSGSAAAAARKQEIVLIPLTKEFFPSPDCPLFVQFHKARCDAAVNYYFRRPGNPGDLSCIPSYASSYRLPGEEEALQQRRRARADRRQQRAAAREATAAVRNQYSDNLFDLDDIEDDLEQSENMNDNGDDKDEEVEEDESYPSREALYRGVVERVEDALFDTDAEMCEAFQWARAHPHTTMGPNGRKQRKVLPVLCAVAFRYDPHKVAATIAAAMSSSTTPPSSSGGAGANPAVSAQHQAAVENGVYMFGSIINIVGCFGFVSMEEEVAALKRELELRNDAGEDAVNKGGTNNHIDRLVSSVGDGAGPEVMHLSSPHSPATGRRYKHDPYSFTSSQDSSFSSSAKDAARSGSLLVSRASLGSGTHGDGGRRGGTAVNSLYALTGTGVPAVDPNSPPPVAAPLAAMVYLTKSAGEQNLGRVTHIAATTYYFQLIQAGVIPRQAVHVPAGAAAPPPPPYYGPGGTASHAGLSPTTPHTPGVGVSHPSASGGPMPTSAAAAVAAASTHHPQAHLPLPPMETFSFSSLLTNIPILSFVYEMKCRWGYLGVFRGTPTSANSSFTEPMPHPASAGGGCGQDTGFEASVNGSMGHAHTSAHHRALLMGTHSSGGLTGVDRTVGQNLTDEIEMWVTVDQMLHGRISKELAERLCWALAERPEVMHERVLQLPSEESGYWRYRGLVDSAHPPPLPQPNSENATPIHPRDVYVMGSDVLPGFNEGDILRFDPDRLVWFSDPSIPLEGVVLAAMRPHCKQAREAPPADPGWVTTIESREKLEYDKEREVRENPALFHFMESEAFPLPPPTQDQEATLRVDANLTRVHKHVGNFFVYKFERDGTTYYHGTVPNFANPNKKRTVAAAGAAPTTVVSTTPSTHPALSASASGYPSQSALSASPAPSISGGKTSSTGITHSATVTALTAGSSATAPAGTGVEVPKSIASALFSLAQPGASTALDKKSATNTAAIVKNNTSSATAAASTDATATKTTTSSAAELPAVGVEGGSGGGGAGADSGTATSPSTSAGATHTIHASTSGTTTTASQSSAPAPSYLKGRVTSGTVMKTAKRWMENLYSYAYGMPKTSPTHVGGSFTELGGAGSHSTTPSHIPGMSPVPPPRTPTTPMARTQSPGASWSSYSGQPGVANRGSPVSPGLPTPIAASGAAVGVVRSSNNTNGGGSHYAQSWSAGRISDGASAVWPQYSVNNNSSKLGAGNVTPVMLNAASTGPSARSATPMGSLQSASSPTQHHDPRGCHGAMSSAAHASPTRGQQGASFVYPAQNHGAPYQPPPAAPAVPMHNPQLVSAGNHTASGSYVASAPPPVQVPMRRSSVAAPTVRRYTFGEDGCYVWT